MEEETDDESGSAERQGSCTKARAVRKALQQNVSCLDERVIYADGGLNGLQASW